MASIGRGVIFLILFVLWSAYVIIGMFVFRAAESNVEREEREGHEDTDRRSMSELRAATMLKHNMTAAEFDSLAGKIRETHDDYHDERQWSYGESFWFVFVLLTTIGKNEGKTCLHNNKIFRRRFRLLNMHTTRDYNSYREMILLRA